MQNLESGVLKIQRLNSERGYDNVKPVPKENVDALKVKFQQELNQVLDKGYIEFLTFSNGIEFNGFVIFSYGQVPNTSYSFTEDIIDSNKMWRAENVWYETKQIFGESADMDLYVKDIPTGEYQIVSKTSNHVIKKFDSFEELISFGINEYTS